MNCAKYIHNENSLFYNKSYNLTCCHNLRLQSTLTEKLIHTYKRMHTNYEHTHGFYEIQGDIARIQALWSTEQVMAINRMSLFFTADNCINGGPRRNAKIDSY